MGQSDNWLKMSLCSQIDVINFQHSGAPEKYNGTFYSSRDRYKVVLSNVVNLHGTELKDNLNPPLNRFMSSVRFNLTIFWKKTSHKFIQIKVCQDGRERTLFEKSFAVPIQSKRSETLITVKKIPANYVISIITCESIVQLKTIAPLLEFPESKGGKELEQLSIDIENLLETSTLSDVTITDGENKMHLHKLILSARSPVFQRMFQSPMKENLEGLVTIKDIPFEVLKTLVIYMYSGAVKIESEEMARDLYIAADKYDVQNLKMISLSVLKLMIKLNNALDILLLAHVYDESALKEAALKFIADNYSAIINLENWNKFGEENLDLTFEIFNFRIKAY